MGREKYIFGLVARVFYKHPRLWPKGVYGALQSWLGNRGIYLSIADGRRQRKYLPKFFICCLDFNCVNYCRWHHAWLGPTTLTQATKYAFKCSKRFFYWVIYSSRRYKYFTDAGKGHWRLVVIFVAAWHGWHPFCSMLDVYFRKVIFVNYTLLFCIILYFWVM